MIYLILLILELVLMFISGRKLINSLYSLLLRMGRNQKLIVYILAFLFLPGVILHELSHLFAAVLLFVPVGSINLWPSMTQNNLKLGSVQIGKTDMVRRFIIGVAPLIVGTGLLVLFHITYSLLMVGRIFLFWQ